MAWFGGQISSLKDQLSVATREFLSESRNETQDHFAELKDAKSHIKLLEDRIEVCKKELSDSRDEVSNLYLKIESLELQNVHVREEFNKQLCVKENEIKRLLKEIKLRRGEPEGECCASDGDFLIRQSDSVEFASDDYLQHLQPSIDASQTEVPTICLPKEKYSRSKDEDLMEMQELVTTLRCQLADCREQKCQEIAALQESNAFTVARLQEHIHMVEKALAKDLSISNPCESEHTDKQNSQQLVSHAVSSSVQTDNSENLSALSDVWGAESHDCSTSIEQMDIKNAVIQIYTEVNKCEALFRDDNEAVCATLDHEDIVHSSTSPQLIMDFLTRLAPRLMVHRERVADLIKRLRCAQTDPENPLDPEHLLERCELYRTESQSSITSFSARDPEVRLLRLLDALRNAVNYLPRPFYPAPSSPSTAKGTRTPPTAPSMPPPWPPTHPEAQVAVLVAAEAAGRAELFRARDALSSSRTIIAQLQAENARLILSLEGNGAGEEGTARVSDFVCPSMHVETVNCSTLTDAEDEFEHRRFGYLYDLLRGLVAAFAGLFRGSDSGFDFEECANALVDLSPSESDLIEYLRDTLKRYQEKQKPKLCDIGIDCECAIVENATLEAVGSSLSFAESQTTNLEDYICNDCVFMSKTLDKFCDELQSGNIITNVFEDSRLYRLAELLRQQCTHQVPVKSLMLSDEDRKFLNRYHSLCALAQELAPALETGETVSILRELKKEHADLDPLTDCVIRLIECEQDAQKKWKQAQADKNSLADLVRRKHAESQGYHAQLQKLLIKKQEPVTANENDPYTVSKLNSELQRLRSHLMQVEENHTREAIAAEEREAGLREVLAKTERQLADLSEFVSSADEKLGHTREERDAARAACRATQSELASLKENHANLQKALENLEKEKQSDVSMETEHFRRETDRLRCEMKDMQQKLLEHQSILRKQEELISTNRALHEQIEKDASRLSDAHAQARRYEEIIQVLKSDRQSLNEELTGKLDKSLMKSLLISCLRLPSAKQPDAFRMLGSLLNFTTEDYNMLGFGEQVGKSWRELFWPKGVQVHQQSEDSNQKNKSSFIELLAEFLERESAPPTQITLPTDYLSTTNASHAAIGNSSRHIRVNSTSTVQQRAGLEAFVEPLAIETTVGQHLLPRNFVSSTPMFAQTTSSLKSTPQQPSKSSASTNPLLSAFEQ